MSDLTRRARLAGLKATVVAGKGRRLAGRALRREDGFHHVDIDALEGGRGEIADGSVTSGKGGNLAMRCKQPVKRTTRRSG